MRKLQVLLLMLGVFAVSAVSASAETAKWLIDGAEIGAGEKYITNASAEILLEDNKAPLVGKAGVLCSEIITGTVEGNGKDLVTEILNLHEIRVSKLGDAENFPLKGTGAGSDCVAETGCAEGAMASPIEVWPVGLPWTTLLAREGGKILDLFSAANGFGYEILCLILGINTEDSCVSNNAEIEIVNDATGKAEMPAAAEMTPLATCSQGGAGSGVTETDELSIILPENDLVALSVSAP